MTGQVYADESLFDRRRGGLLTDYAVDTPDFGGQLSALDYDHGSALKKLGPARSRSSSSCSTSAEPGIQATPGQATGVDARRGADRWPPSPPRRCR